MIRALLSIVVGFSSSSAWLVDSALKGAALLAIAGLIACCLRRDSAASRHIVWLVAFFGVFAVPLLSLSLPQWRVLPAWASLSDANLSPALSDAMQPLVSPRGQWAAAIVDESSAPQPSSTLDKVVSSPNQLPKSVTADSLADRPNDAKAPTLAGRLQGDLEPWYGPLLAMAPWVWASVAGGLLCRLLAARVILWRTELQSRVIYRPSHDTSDWALFEAMCLASNKLRIPRPVKLLVHPRKTIPMVWGIWRKRLLIPDAARHWSDEQLRSVLLHELAHIQRGDTLWQLLAQVACALHWVDPLVWIAAWRLHVERERACDDLVLANGVRASAYAEHLLEVSTLTSSPWTQACGLAMARRTSLQARLLAVLNAKQNRRSVTSVVLVMSVAVCATIAIPLAMISAASNTDASEITATLSAGSADKQNSDEATNPDGPTELAPGLEQHLDWSEPIGGLRAAVMIRSLETPGILGRERRIHLVIQNVSEKTIRFCDSAIQETETPAADTEGRNIYLKDSGEIMFVIQNAKSTRTDINLQPRAVLSIDMFDKEKPNDRGHKASDALAEGIVKMPTQSLSAVLNIVHAPEGAWTGKLTTPTTRGAFAAVGPMPQSKEGQVLFRYCIDRARLQGDIPGGLIDCLHDLVKEFIQLNTGDQYGDPYAMKMKPLLARFDHNGDWKQAEAIALFDDIAAVSAIPLTRTVDKIRENTLQRGMPLAPSFKNANWGESLPGGLRMAWILEPREDEYHLDSSLKSHVVLHNSGKEPVIFVTRSFHQPQHQAVTSAGETVKLESTFWTTLGRPEPYRLHPGESCEVHAPGVGIGARNNELEDWSNVRPGTWIHAKPETEIKFQPGAVVLSGDHNEKVDPDWWLKFITQRLERDTPFPADEKEREVVLFRVVSDLFGTSPHTDEASAFLADHSSDAVSNLAKLLSTRTWHTAVTGTIKSGELKFRVLVEDRDAVTRPRVAKNPGHYNLGEQMRLSVTRRPSGDRVVNEANIVWFPPGKENVSTKVPLPGGYDSWAAGWAPGTKVLWVIQKDLLSSFDFTDNAAVKEARYQGKQIESAPISPAVRKVLQLAMSAAAEDPKTNQKPPAVAAPASQK